MIKSKIKQVAEANGITTAYQLMKRIDVVPTVATRLWNGDVTRFSVDVLEKLCEAFGVGVGDLLEYQNNKNTTQEVLPEKLPAKKSKPPTSRAVETAESDNEFYTVKEAAEILGKGEATIKRWLDSGKLQGERVESSRGGDPIWRVFKTGLLSPENVEAKG